MMTTPPFTRVYNTQSISTDKIPILSIGEFRDAVIQSVREGKILSAFYGMPLPNHQTRLVSSFANSEEGSIYLTSTDVDKTYSSLTPDCPSAHWFEREIAEQWGVKPEGHPWLKPIRFQPSYSPGHDAWNRPQNRPIHAGVTDFYRVEGEEIHEVAVGPVHAGIIEPGHFRFQCFGENVLHLEISLGYQHRGIERRLIGGPDKRTLHYMETAAGDTTIGHALASCQIVESLASAKVPARAQALRGIALELERLANHIGDLGALAGDVGFLPTASYCGRLRGEFLNMTALLCGSRLGRGFIRPGGVGYDLDAADCEQLLNWIKPAMKDVHNAVNLLWESPSVMARFEETGVIDQETCRELGLVGVAARACGLERDIRFEFPTGIYRFGQILVSTWNTGDVFARAHVRWMEIQRSADFICGQLENLPEGDIRAPLSPLAPNQAVVSLTEGWRGEICHVAFTDFSGRFAHYKIVDPSFHNWMGLALALRDQPISDFPLCNKSFNLSYCGHDL